MGEVNSKALLNEFFHLQNTADYDEFVTLLADELARRKSQLPTGPLLVVFEGTSGVGKSCAIHRLGEKLRLLSEHVCIVKRDWFIRTTLGKRWYDLESMNHLLRSVRQVRSGTQLLMDFPLWVRDETQPTTLQLRSDSIFLLDGTRELGSLSYFDYRVLCVGSAPAIVSRELSRKKRLLTPTQLNDAIQAKQRKIDERIRNEMSSRTSDLIVWLDIDHPQLFWRKEE